MNGKAILIVAALWLLAIGSGLARPFQEQAPTPKSEYLRTMEAMIQIAGASGRPRQAGRDPGLADPELLVVLETAVLTLVDADAARPLERPERIGRPRMVE